VRRPAAAARTAAAGRATLLPAPWHDLGRQYADAWPGGTGGKGTTRIEAADGEGYEFPTCWRCPGVATGVFTLAVTSIAAARVHALAATHVWSVVGWSIPGVLVGSALGSRVGKWLPAERMEKALGSVFAAVGLLMLGLQLGR